MSDTRTWFKTDVGYFDNPKVDAFLEDSPYVLLLHLRAIAYCRQHLTDGVFPVRRVAALVCATFCGSQCESHTEPQCDVCKASHVGLILRIDDRNYSVHDYDKHQQTAEQVNRRKAAGQKASKVRWGHDGDTKSHANRNANRIPDRNAEKRREEKNTTRTADAAAFEEFWAIYDKKRGKAKSRTKWAKIIKTTDPQVIIDAARTYIDTLKARGDHPQYTKDPLTWLNGEHWEDEIEPNTQQDPYTNVPLIE